MRDVAFQNYGGKERAVIPRQIINRVDIETIELRLSNPDTPDKAVEELYRFGQILFSECLQRGSELDRKLTNFLGWSTAALAFLLLNHTKIGVVTGTIATVLAVVTILIASVALKTRMWPVPSEQD